MYDNRKSMTTESVAGYNQLSR